MSLLLYAISDEYAAGELSGAGLDGERLRVLDEDGLAAVVSDYPSTTPPTSADVLLSYEDAVERLMDRHAILPAQFGSVFAEEDEVRALLRTRREDLTRALTRVRGTVELAVTAAWRHVPAGKPQTGTEYLLTRLERQRRATAIVEHLEPLARRARSSRQVPLPRAELAVSAAYLVSSDATSEFTSLLAELAEQLDDVEVTCTGPWPPYTFAEARA